ncbi:MAG: DUF6311 domain-containing protein [Verrucomicrobiota bacterium]|nr:DUF6311 domain-containing protein [Verrucomicrobiota bacterium]
MSLFRWLAYNRLAEICGACLGLIIGLTYFDSDFIRGTANWRAFSDDRLETMIGANYFLSEGWHFPLLDISGYNYPEGTNMAMTDSIPLVGLLIKCLSMQPFTVNYMGYWLLFCCIMQGWMSVRLMKALGHRDLFLLVLAALFALSFPAFIFRSGHAALFAHFVILGALALAIEGRRSEFSEKYHIKFAVLAIISALIHIYLLAMVMALYLGYCIQNTTVITRRIWLAIASFLGLCVVLVGLFYLLGILRIGQSIPATSGYGLYSMNLLSPFWPQWSGLFKIVSPFAPPLIQWEGFIYLGLGIIIILSLSLLVEFRHWVRLIRENWGVIVILILLVVFSLSDNIYLSKYKILEYNMPFKSLCDQFRSSGRFIWPVGYTVMFFALHIVIKRFYRWIAYVLLITCGVLQHIDSRGANVAGSKCIPLASEDEIHYWQSIEKTIMAHKVIYLFPYYGCHDAYVNYRTVQIAYLASIHNLPFNAAYLARGGKQCSDMNTDLANLKQDESMLIILMKGAYTKEDASIFAGDLRYISEFKDCYMISKRIEP